MKKLISVLITGLLLISTITPQITFGAFIDDGLTWDGKPATLTELSQKTGYDFIDENGDYIPLYTYFAEYLWEIGLFTDSDGTLNLDKPVTRADGIILVLRLMCKEQEALDAKLTVSFADVPDWALYQVAYAAQIGIVSGYSDTVFGSGDAMSANEFITLVLRAMGFADEEDFTCDKAVDTALEIGLIGSTCREQYMRSNLFLRDNAAVILYNALALQQAAEDVKMSGNTAQSVSIESNGAANGKITLTSGVGNITMEFVSSGQGGVAAVVGYTAMRVGDYSGSLDIVYTVNGVSKTHTVTVEKNTTYTLTYTYAAEANNDIKTYQPGQKIMTGIDPITKMPKYIETPGTTTTIPGAAVNNTITIFAGGSVCSETVSIKGKLSTGSLNLIKK